MARSAGADEAHEGRRATRSRGDVIDERSVEGALEQVVLLLRLHAQRDFSRYRRSLLVDRVQRRVGVHHLAGLDDYVRFLHQNPEEAPLLAKELLVGVTAFFRDPAAWAALEAEALPALFAQRADGERLRAWVVGCSTGQDAYSLAIAMLDALPTLAPKRLEVEIFGTDLDPDAIEKARRAVYPPTIAADVGRDRLARYFVPEGEDGGWHVGRALRQRVIFATHDLLRDPPFQRLDLVVCRNLLVHLEPEAHREVFARFHSASRPGGIVFIGGAEAVHGAQGLFSPLRRSRGLYVRDGAARASVSIARSRPEELRPPTRPTPPFGGLEALAERATRERFAPAVVLVNGAGDVLHGQGETARYLDPTGGALNVFAMARAGLHRVLWTALDEARATSEVVAVRGIDVRAEGLEAVDLTVQSMAGEGLLGTFLVTFSSPGGLRPVAALRGPASREGLEREAEDLRRQLQAVREQMIVAQEEQQTTTEELLAENEDLRAANHALSTEREDLLLVNDGLRGANQELQAELADARHASMVLKELIDRTGVAFLALDPALGVRWFTEDMTRLIRIRPSDHGRRITDLSTDLIYPDLGADVEEVLRTHTVHVREVSSRDRRWFIARTVPDRAGDGVVMIFSDITFFRETGVDSAGGRAQDAGRGEARR